MSKLAQTLIKDMPPYLEMIVEPSVPTETPEQSKQRLIDKINKYNGGST